MAVGNPKIADYAFGPQDATRTVLTFIGLKEGATNVVILDPKTGEEVYKSDIIVSSEHEVPIRVYNGMNEGRGFICYKTNCIPEPQQAQPQ